MMHVDEAKELQVSEVWRKLCQELDSRILGLMQQLSKAATWEDSIRLQARIQAMTELKNLPLSIVERES